MNVGLVPVDLLGGSDVDIEGKYDDAGNDKAEDPEQSIVVLPGSSPIRRSREPWLGELNSGPFGRSGRVGRGRGSR